MFFAKGTPSNLSLNGMLSNSFSMPLTENAQDCSFIRMKYVPSLT